VKSENNGFSPRGGNLLTRTVPALFALIALTLCLDACFRNPGAQGSLSGERVMLAQIAPFAPKQAKPVRIGVMPDAGNLPLYLMEGVEAVPFQSAVERDAALASGALDGISGDLVTVLVHQQRGIELKALTVTESRFLVVAGPKFRALGGEARWNVGVSENTVIEYITDTLCADIAGKLDKISIPQVPLRLEMLRNGQIPLACLTDVMAWDLLKGGFRILRDQSGSGLEPAVLALSGEFLRRRGEEVQTLTRRWNETAGKINADPEAYSALLMEKVRLPASDYPVPHYREITPPTEAQVSSVVDWYAAKYGLSRPVAYGDLVILE